MRWQYPCLILRIVSRCPFASQHGVSADRPLSNKITSSSLGLHTWYNFDGGPVLLFPIPVFDVLAVLPCVILGKSCRRRAVLEDGATDGAWNGSIVAVLDRRRKHMMTASSRRTAPNTPPAIPPMSLAVLCAAPRASIVLVGSIASFVEVAAFTPFGVRAVPFVVVIVLLAGFVAVVARLPVLVPLVERLLDLVVVMIRLPEVDPLAVVMSSPAPAEAHRTTPLAS